MLYEAGQLKNVGRVDHKDSSLDYEDFERSRGITAFSKQAVFSYGNTDFSIIDTPGHADLLAETKRGLRVPDAAILVISGSEGVQADTGTVWELLRRQKIPTWIFVSKMDLPGSRKEKVLNDLKKNLSDAVTDFTVSGDQIAEEAALFDESCMEEYLDGNLVSDTALSQAIQKCNLFPCFFGSGLKLEGVKSFLEALNRWMPEPEWPEDFSALCFKIARDAKGQRMSLVKITGGRLSVRQTVHYRNVRGMYCEEKITAIRIYSGARYENVGTVTAGQVCSLLGLSETSSGCVLGENVDVQCDRAESVQRYTLSFDPPQDPVVMMAKLMELSEELPELQPVADQHGLSVCLSGKMQGDMFKAVLFERTGIRASLSEGRIIYRETVGRRVEGIGHFEPLRHYAEVHLILEPLPRGSGICLESVCPEDMLDRNWQNLILDTLRITSLRGVLTGAVLTDTRIILVSGRAHPKHTEGGDFREATLRALRNGLMQADCQLLEPLLHFVITLPSEQLGRVFSDLRAMHAEFASPEQNDDTVRLEGTVPANELGEYRENLLAFTHGLGRMTVHPGGYQLCHNSAQILAETEYSPERDTDWPADSVFCAHGSGFSVPWDQVKNYMHLESALDEQNRKQQEETAVHRLQRIDDRELEAIMLREFGPVKRRQYTGHSSVPSGGVADAVQRKSRTVIIDGYNFIFADHELKQLARQNLDLARSRLMDRLSNYAGFTGDKIILVFDGFRTAGNPGSKKEYSSIHIVFTPERETADAYMERLAADIGKNDRVAVVTGDTMIRISAMRSGILRISPQEFGGELENTEYQLREILERSNLLAHQVQGSNAVSKEIGKENAGI